MSQPAILFVCLGNICRSPLAEAAFRRRAAEAGIACTVDSAGTGGWHAGNAPDPRAIAEARRHGIDIAGYRARQVRREDFGRFTHILAADRDNLADLLALAPTGTAAQVVLLLDWAEGLAGRPVADPYYGDTADFARTWAEVDAAAVGLTRALRGG